MAFSGGNLVGNLRLRPQYENSALFLWLGPLSTSCNPSRKRSFPKHSSNRRNSKTLALSFSANEKRFENKAFQNDDVRIIK